MDMPEQQVVLAQLRAVWTVLGAMEATDVERLAEAREHAMAIGPLFQPTSWLQHGFDGDRNIVEAAQQTAKLIRHLRRSAGLPETGYVGDEATE
jgi:hypothetical protein